MALLDDIAHYLDDQTTGLTLLSGTGGAGNMVKARLLDHGKIPDTAVGLYETAGWQPQWVFSTGSTSPAFETAGLQCVARSTSYAVARQKAYLVYRLLDPVAGQVLPHSSSGTRYYRIAAVGPPFGIGQDQNGRYMVSVNFDVTKVRSS